MRKKLLRDLEDHGEKIIDGDKLKFAKLAERYSAHKLKPPIYKGETKISGLRSWKNQLVFLKPLVIHFGKMGVKAITHADIQDYKAMRVEQPVRYKRMVNGKPVYHEKERTIVGVNRELMLMRAILNFAVRNGWLSRQGGAGSALGGVDRPQEPRLPWSAVGGALDCARARNAPLGFFTTCQNLRQPRG
jgi:hypothetical protein